MPARLALAVTLAVAVGLTEGLRLLILVPLLQLVGLDTGGSPAGELRDRIAGAFADLGLRPTLPLVLLGLGLVLGGRALLQRWATLVQVSLGESLLLQLRTRLYRAIIGAQWVFLARMRTGALSYALTTELERVGRMAPEVLALVTQLLGSLVLLALAVQLSPAMTVVASACGVTLLVLLRRRARRATAAGERLDQSTGVLFASAAEHLAAVKTAKSYGAEARSAKLFEGLSEEVAQANRDAARLHTSAEMMFEIGSVVALLLLLYAGLAGFQLSSGTTILLLLVYSRLVPRFASFQVHYHNLLHELPAFSAVTRLIAQCEAESERAGDASARGTPFRRGVRLESVSFAYPGGGLAPAVVDLSMWIPARRWTAIVGPSGAGKSTIADLLTGLLRPTSGRVRVDGLELDADRHRVWRNQIGYVDQEGFLFHDTVRENLLWAAPAASDAELWAALRAAAAESFVRELPNGIDSVIGERGVALSAGQRQRLTLARALIRGPSLLILDEATNAVDAETERCIMHELGKLHERTAILLITHRLVLARSADLIYHVEGGRAVESGPWEELLALNGRFAAMYRTQEAQGSHDTRELPSREEILPIYPSAAPSVSPEPRAPAG